MVQHPGAAKLVIALVVIVVLGVCSDWMAFMASSWTCGGNHFSVESAAVT